MLHDHIDWLKGAEGKTGEAQLMALLASMLIGSENARRSMLPGVEIDFDFQRIAMQERIGANACDLFIEHKDASVTIIEVKDGTRGVNTVLNGIGQVCMYAEDWASKSPGVRVNAVVLWSSTGRAVADARLSAACRRAGVIPCRLPQLKLMAELIPGCIARAEEALANE